MVAQTISAIIAEKIKKILELDLASTGRLAPIALPTKAAALSDRP
jgi:hypothetical protein